MRLWLGLGEREGGERSGLEVVLWALVGGDRLDFMDGKAGVGDDDSAGVSGVVV